MTYASLEDWLNETEGYGVRAERIPAGAYPWIAEAWKLGAAARCSAESVHDLEPVAWRSRWKNGSPRDREWEMWTYHNELPSPNDKQIIEPLYAAPQPADSADRAAWAINGAHEFAEKMRGEAQPYVCPPVSPADVDVPARLKAAKDHFSGYGTTEKDKTVLSYLDDVLRKFEALEDYKRRQMEDIMTLGQEIGRLTPAQGECND